MSSTPKHTPGPWQAVEPCEGVSRTNAYGAEWKVTDSFEDIREIVAFVPAHERTSAEANARLLAAAPEYLTLLTEARETLNALHEILGYYHKAAIPENDAHEDVCANPECCGHCLARRRSAALLARIDAALADPEPPNTEHEWTIARFTGTKTCARCGLLPLEPSDYELSCEPQTTSADSREERR